MIRRKLIIVNIVIITLTLGLATFFETRALRGLLYRENTLSYNNMISSAYASLDEIFTSGQDKLLTVCASRQLQNLLHDGLPERGELEEAAGNLRDILSVEGIHVYPVIDDDVYIWNSESRMYDVEDNGLFNYKLDYAYDWNFRPDGRAVVTVTRAMYSLEEIEKIIAIASVDISLTDFTEIIYSFKGNSPDDYLCLLDEDNNYLIPSNRTGQLDIREAENGMIDSSVLTKDKGILTVYNRFRHNKWKMVAVMSASALFQDSRNQIKMTWLASAILEILGIIMTFVVTNRITEPIKQLSGEIHEVRTTRQFTHINPPEKIDGEIAELYDSYNQLIDQVNQSMADVEEFSRKDAENEFKLLQAEINPHFLYNTLNTISWMAANDQTDDIQNMIMALVGLYRISLNNGKATLPLRMEVEHVRNYLEIMAYRYPDKYQAVYDIDEDTKELIVTKQILQPLAENALMHGFVEGNNKGIIRISSRIEGDYLVLKVANTGSPAELEKIEKLLNNDPELSTKHYGIRNVNDRLMMYYGQQCHLEYDIVDGETVASMKLPLDKLKMENNYE